MPSAPEPRAEAPGKVVATANGTLPISGSHPNIPPMDQPTAPRPTKRCPICGKPALHRFRPFCSKRCTDIDLNRWLSGTYAIPGTAAANKDESGDED